MEKDFHHHLIFALAHKAGFNKKKGDRTEAHVVAYASQYVDDNCNRSYVIPRNGKEYSLTLPERLDVGTSLSFYYPLMTQSVDIKALDLHTQYYMFMPFHFLPGDTDTVKIAGMSNPYCTTKNSANAKKLLRDALKSGDIYGIGIALHTYADTWSHQRFTAFNESWNKVLDWYKDFMALAPDIGHADVWHLPDQICKTWRDHRFDEGPVDNRDRAFEAAKQIYATLGRSRNSTPWGDITTDIEGIIYLDSSVDGADERKVYDERKKRIEAFVGVPLDYDRDEWISEVLDFDLEKIERHTSGAEPGDEEPVPTNIRLKDNFRESRWHKFQVAAKTQLSQVVGQAAHL